MLKASWKILFLFVAMLFIGIPILKVWADYRLPAPGTRRIVLQITEKGQFNYFQASLLAADGQAVFTRRSGFHRDYYDVPVSATLLRIEEGIPAAKPTPEPARAAKGTAGKPVPPAPALRKLLREVPLPPAKGRGATECYFDVDPTFEVSRIGIWEAMVSSQPGGVKFGMGLVAVVSFLTFVLAPISIGAAAYVLIKEREAGIRREFCGSWFKFLVGLGWLALGFHFHIVQSWFPPQGFFSLVGICLLPGYPLYFIAQLGFNAEEARREREAATAETWRLSESYTYTDYYDGHGNKVGSTKGSAALGSFLGAVLFFLIVPLLLPIATFTWMFLRYALPLFVGHRPWQEPEGPAPEPTEEELPYESV
jgi:hypothetical protein